MTFWNYNSVPLPSSTGYTHQRFGWLSIILHYVAFIAQPSFILYANPHCLIMFGRVDTKFDMIRTKCKLLWIYNSQLVSDRMKRMVQTLIMASKQLTVSILATPTTSIGLFYRRRSFLLLNESKCSALIVIVEVVQIIVRMRK